MTRLLALVTALMALPLSAATLETNGVVMPLGAAPQILIPAAGSTAGANGTFFRSDITLINFGDVPQQVHMQWLPQAGESSTTADVILPARTGMTSEDFVTQFLGVQGLGSILISGETSSDAFDPNAKLYATSRIWTPQSGTGGTTSQSLDVVPPGTTMISRAAIFGLRRDSRYRANIGIVNLDPSATVTFVVTASPNGDVYTVTVPPMSMQQVSLTASSTAISQITIATGAPSLWLAYGSSIDNVSGDSWSELALPSQ
jgi:hypothetical protein